MMQAMSQIDTDLPNFDGLSHQMKSKSKRERASWQQRIVLEKVFQNNQYPDLTIRNQLAMQLGMSPRKIQIWFQNRRTKAKHKQVKSPQDAGHAEGGSDINLQNKNGNTLLLIAASLGHSSVEYLLSKGAKVNISNTTGQTPLYAAVRNGHENIVELLLQKEDCNVNIREFEHGESPLHVAVLKGNVKVTAMLLERAEDLNVNIRDHDNFTPLHHACIYGHIAIVKLLLANKADVNVQSNEGYTPLHAASLNGNTDIITLLLDHGANLNFADNFGYSALSFAIREEKLEAVNLLLKRGSINTRTADGFTPLLIAACRKSLDTIKRLVEAGCDVHAVTQKQRNALHLAVMHGHLSVIQYFLEQGVSKIDVDCDKKTPLDYAILYNHQEAKTLLQKSQDQGVVA